MKNIVVLTGAGMSAESGLSTFRDSGGLWESYDIMDVASVEGWQRNKELVLRFYNDRRKQAYKAKPNAGHYALADLEQKYNVTIITQNVDNLHERAGSTDVIHLHGELSKARSSVDENDVVEIGDEEIALGQLCKKGSQFRPNIVWFGEMVPLMNNAMDHTQAANIFIVLGTSLVVYPAAGLIDYVPEDSAIHLIDPVKPDTYIRRNINYIKETATIGTPRLVEMLLNKKEGNEL
ncbi:MAG: NAD-dependent deacylase [Balneolales bacterium]